MKLAEMNYRIAVTGAAGLVGQNLIPRLKAGGFSGIVAIDKHPTNTAVLRRLHPDIQIIQADLASDDGWQEAVAACDVVIVCGGPGWPDAAADKAMLAYLRRLRPEGVASVCTGALLLSASGVLDGKLATTRRNAVGAEAMAPLERLGQSGVVRTTAAQVVDAGVVTGGGVSLAIDATLYLLGRIYGDDALA